MRDDALLIEEDEWVLLGGVQLVCEPLVRELERRARSAVHLGDAAEAERILQASCCALLPEVAVVEERTEPLRRLQRAEIAGERLEVECSGNIECVEQPRCVRKRKRCERG
jgi:hypothetical protein